MPCWSLRHMLNQMCLIQSWFRDHVESARCESDSVNVVMMEARRQSQLAHSRSWTIMAKESFPVSLMLKCHTVAARIASMLQNMQQPATLQWWYQNVCHHNPPCVGGSKCLCLLSLSWSNNVASFRRCLHVLSLPCSNNVASLLRRRLGGPWTSHLGIHAAAQQPATKRRRSPPSGKQDFRKNRRRSHLSGKQDFRLLMRLTQLAEDGKAIARAAGATCNVDALVAAAAIELQQERELPHPSR